MGSKKRNEVEGGIYHVTSRGNAQETIFHDEVDFLTFLRVLAAQVTRCAWLCHSYCLMPNHYHLLLETPETNLARGMRLLNGTFAQRFNGRYGRYGHVFQGPYGALPIADEHHLAEAIRYIALNPVRAGLVDSPASWPWSSYRPLAGIQEPPTFLRLDLVHSLLGGPAGYRSAIADAMRERQRPGRDHVATWSQS